MIYLTELLATPVVDREGRRVGKLRDVALAPAEDPRRVSAFVVDFRGRRMTVNSGRATLTGGRLQLNAAEDLTAYTPRPEDLLVTKDLLDQQIIDINGRKVVRVNDVSFEEAAGRELWLTAVDVGLTGALRRLFQGIVPMAALRRAERYLPAKFIVWDFVDLLEPDPQRRVKLKITHDKLAKLHPADLADIVEELAPAEREAIFESLDEEKAAEALSEVEPKVQVSIIESLDPEKAADIVEEMAPDEAADLLQELPNETSEEILEDMEKAEAAEIEELLEYSEDTAGGMMNTDLVAVQESGTAQTAIDALRGHREIAAATNTIFTVDLADRLTGAIPLVELLLVPPSTPLREIRPERLVSAGLDTKESEVIELFDKYNLLSLPVVDEQEMLAGVITADDVISVLRAKK
jgi:sporulation protein YlmC with PRC-barrel domain